MKNFLGLFPMALLWTNCAQMDASERAINRKQFELRALEPKSAIVSQSQIQSLFRDQVAFTKNDLLNGKTSCKTIVERPQIEQDVMPWPSDLKEFLAQELSKFPAVDLAVDSLYAVYLIIPEAMAGTNGSSPPAGMACDRGPDNRGIIFLNYQSFVTDRSKNGQDPGQWQTHRAVSNDVILIETGDNAALTFIHEIIHSIDNRKLINGFDPNLLKKRHDIFNLSWDGFSKPKFQRTDIAFLTGQDTLTTNHDPKQLSEQLKYLAESTNFIVPYTMATAAEDLAESLTVYYFGVYQSSWQIRTVYDHPINRKATKELYRHDTERILNSQSSASEDHRKKLCAMAELLFGYCKWSL